ncbi:hypothetical protein AC1031_016783 [Aphanomyces cochlioides]|nr:hypothetical protein AC1031_016783 [Aphanomyces cochlioides]
MSESHENVHDEPLREGDNKDFNAAMLEGIDFMDDNNAQEGDEDEQVKEEGELEGNREANEAATTQGNLSTSIAAIRQRNLRDTKKQLVQSWHDRMKDLEDHLANLKERAAKKKRIN